MKIAITAYADDTYEAACIVEALKNVRSIELDSYSGRVKVDKVFDKKPEPQVRVEEPQANETPEPAENENPGFTACTRIGGDTKDAILKNLPCSDAEHLGKKIKRTAEQTEALLQLLWDRGDIEYRGGDFVLPVEKT